jgi:uncharacterized protein (TIGR02145 family)
MDIPTGDKTISFNFIACMMAKIYARQAGMCQLIQLPDGKIKETGTLHWTSPNTGATNETGFTALPAGYRDYIDGAYKGIGTLCSLWSKDQMTSTQGFSKYVHNYEIGFTWIFNEKQYGMSVRCLRD